MLHLSPLWTLSCSDCRYVWRAPVLYFSCPFLCHVPCCFCFITWFYCKSILALFLSLFYKFFFKNVHYLTKGPGSSVGIVTDYELDGPGSNPGGDNIFRLSRPALGPTQPPVQWVPGLSWRYRQLVHGAEPPHPHLEGRGPRKSRAIPLLTLRVFMVYKMGENLPTII